MKEMIGGCCVCSDEEGSDNNPIVYCDGKDCFVAVHKGCYGIQNIPDDAWFCKKCESGDRSARVRCDLCPIKEGALKKTKNGGWCHVLCALFIPEVDFVNMYTMEPITLDRLSNERLGKVCFICQEKQQLDLATRGACITCNDSNCKIPFHASCAHIRGLLIEERGARSKLITYVGYCPRHFKKAILPDTQKVRNIIARPLPAFQHPKSAVNISDQPTMQVPPIKLNLSLINNCTTSKRHSISSAQPLISSVGNPIERDSHKTPGETHISNNFDESGSDEVQQNDLNLIDVKQDEAPENNSYHRNNTIRKRRKRVVTSSGQNKRSFTKKAAINSLINKNRMKSEPSTVAERKKTQLPQYWKQYDNAKPFKQDFDLDALYSNNASTQESDLHLPSRRSTLSDLDLVLPQTSDESNRKKMKSMEELLDWQWDQGASLLMQQSQSSDIVTLLNSLHVLRKENDGLEGKALKLLRKRDHLLYINAQLKQILSASGIASELSSTVTDDEKLSTPPPETDKKPPVVLTGIPTIKIFSANKSS